MTPAVNRQLPGVDLAKFVMAFAVIAIHVSARSAVGLAFPETVQWFIALAVPFFFITSGYLLGKKLADTSQIQQKRELLLGRSRNLFKIFICWLIIYLPITIYIYSLRDYPLWKDVLSYLRCVIINGESQYAWPLWFIYSMAIVCFILSKALFRKYSLTVLTTAFIIVNFLNNSVSLGYISGGNQFVSLFNTLTSRTLGGGIYIIAGIIIYKYETRLSNYYSVISLIIYSIVSYFLNLPFSALSGGVAIFLFSLLLKPHESATYLILRKLSMWIYYIHMLVIFPYITIAHHYNHSLNLWSTYVICSIITFIVAIILNWLSSTNRFKWLNALIK